MPYVKPNFLQIYQCPICKIGCDVGSYYYKLLWNSQMTTLCLACDSYHPSYKPAEREVSGIHIHRILATDSNWILTCTAHKPQTE